MVKFLIERGACIFATTTNDHETPADKCEEDEEGFDGCSQFLFGIQVNMFYYVQVTLFSVLTESIAGKAGNLERWTRLRRL